METRCKPIILISVIRNSSNADAENDINFKADRDFNFEALRNVNIKAHEELRIESGHMTNMRVGTLKEDGDFLNQ